MVTRFQIANVSLCKDLRGLVFGGNSAIIDIIGKIFFNLYIEC